MTERDLKNIFGKHVSSRRERKGWSKEKLAEKADVSKNTISDIETGQKFARAKTLVRLAKVLETDVYELLKPFNVLPDKSADIFAKFHEEVRESVERIGNSYLGKMEQ